MTSFEVPIRKRNMFYLIDFLSVVVLQGLVCPVGGSNQSRARDFVERIGRHILRVQFRLGRFRSQNRTFIKNVFRWIVSLDENNRSRDGLRLRFLQSHGHCRNFRSDGFCRRIIIRWLIGTGWRDGVIPFALLKSVSSTFNEQLLQAYSFANKLQSQTLIREKLRKLHSYKKGACKMLVKLTPKSVSHS